MGVIFEGTIYVAPKAFQSTRFGKGRAYADPKKTAYMNMIRFLMRQQMKQGFVPTDKPIKLTMKFIFDRPKSSKKIHPSVRPDVDNLAKPAKDSLTKLLWLDDSQVCQYGEGFGKYYDQTGGGPRIYIKVEEL